MKQTKPKLQSKRTTRHNLGAKFEPDCILDKFVPICAHCGALLAPSGQECTGSYPEIELQGELRHSISSLIKTYRVLFFKQVSSTHKKRLKNTIVGSRLAIEIVILSVQHRLPLRRITQSLLETYKVKLSPVAIQKVSVKSCFLLVKLP